MEQNKISITPENSGSWLASCGFIFPANPVELARFNRLFGEIDPAISGAEVDPFRIISKVAFVDKQSGVTPLRSRADKYRMVARKLKPLPSHITEKLKEQKGRGLDNPDTPAADK